MRQYLGLLDYDGCQRSAHAEQINYNPAKVSDSLKAIFQFGSVSTKRAMNANTVIGGTYVQFGADLEASGDSPEQAPTNEAAVLIARLREGIRLGLAYAALLEQTSIIPIDSIELNRRLSDARAPSVCGPRVDAHSDSCAPWRPGMAAIRDPEYRN